MAHTKPTFIKRITLAAVAAFMGLGLAFAGPVSGSIAGPAKASAASTQGFAYAWDNVLIDGNLYHIRASVTTVRDKGTTTTTTTCDYFNQFPAGTGWQQYQNYYVGRYQVSGAQATNEAELQSFCVSNFYNRV
jgi:hypothetical protein